ncbi:hypothetical protein [Petrachloros mirabilis]
MDSDELLKRAITAISQSDPLVKLLEQVKLGRMKPTDAGLRAITESWLETYRKMVETNGLSKQALRRIDPTPRVAMLVQSGVVSPDHSSVKALQASFEKALTQAED